jgi:hypothetical protein
VVLLVLAAVGGLVAGRVRRPVGGHGALPHVHHVWLVVVGIVLAMGAALLDGDLAVLCDALSIAVLAAFAGANRNVTGIAVIGLGLVLNLAAVVLDNGMPVRPKALVQADVVEAHELADHEVGSPRHLETDSDAFGWLGAIVPIPGLRVVVTFGDLMILLGLADAARDFGRRRSPAPEVDDDELWPVPESERVHPEPTAQPEDEATNAASVDQDCGDAPSPSPESGDQCSAKPLRTTALDNEFWKDAALPPSPAHLAARHDR